MRKSEQARLALPHLPCAVGFEFEKKVFVASAHLDQLTPGDPFGYCPGIEILCMAMVQFGKSWASKSFVRAILWTF